MSLNNPKISIIIPVLNEAICLNEILAYLKQNSSTKNILEIIVVDGGSLDNTIAIALSSGASVLKSPKGRAKQLNIGAKSAKGDILYFLHVDTLPPNNFDQSIIESFKKGNIVGCFQMKFDSNSLFLNFFAWFTRVNHILCRGGDQSLFVAKNLYYKAGGFNENYIIYEDNEFINRLYKLAPFTILKHHVKTSARRYEDQGEVKLQYHFGVIHLKSYFGASPEQLHDYYKRKIAN